MLHSSRFDQHRKSAMLMIISCVVVSSLFGCANVFYTKTPTGSFAGKLTVEWVAPNQFIYRPDGHAPLVYTASDGRRIQPELMYTDGGSIPRLFWSAPSLGPWDFAPGYIMHDWLFHQHHCRIGNWQSYDFPQSAQILAEGIKTQMEKAGTSEPSIVLAIYEAVRSPIAESLWNDSPCKAPTPTNATSSPTEASAVPVVILRIEAR